MRTMQLLLQLLMLFFVWFVKANDSSCSGGPPACVVCTCTVSSITCQFQLLTQIPSGIPNTVSTIDLSGNIIEVIPPNCFIGYEQVTYINLSNNKIRNISANAFSGMPNLKKAFLSYNALTELPEDLLSVTTSLTEFGADTNALTSIPTNLLLAQSNLKILELNNNLIEALPNGFLKPFPKLVDLKLDHNRLRVFPDLSYHDYYLLSTFTINNNRIRYIGPRDLAHVPVSSEGVDLSYNLISNISADAFYGTSTTNAITVDLSHNLLSTLPPQLFQVSALNHLPISSLDLSNNFIRVFNSTENGLDGSSKTLKTINLSSNCLRTMKFGPLAFSHLTTLSASNNNLTSFEVPTAPRLAVVDASYNFLSVVTASMFQGASKISEISLSFCTIHQIHPDAFVTLKSLKILQLSGNQRLEESLSDNLFNGLSLTLLNLTACGLTTIQNGTFNGLSASTVDLQLNNFTSWNWCAPFSFHGLSCDTLSLSKCGMTSLCPFLFGGVTCKSISLRNNRLSTVASNTFADSAGITNVNLDSNELTSLQSNGFAGLQLVQTLDIPLVSCNALPPAAFNGLESLQTLDLSDVGLAYLASGAFSGLLSLTSLNLSHNLLTVLPNEAFYNMSALTELDLSSNMFSVLVGSWFSFGSTLPILSSLLLHNNNINNLWMVVQAIAPIAQSLELLDLSFNRLSASLFSVFSGSSLPHVATLNISFNLLGTLPSSNSLSSYFPSLHTLDMSSSNLLALEANSMSGLTHLETLLLQNNSIGVIDPFAFAGLSAVTQLNLRLALNINILSANMFAGLTKLPLLDLSASGIISAEDYAFQGLVSLTTLNLQSNLLESLNSSRLFAGLDALQSLDVSNNNLGFIACDVFLPMSNTVQFLNMNNNQIDTWKPCESANTSSPMLYNLTTLDLRNNLIPFVSKFSTGPLYNLMALLLDANLIAGIEANLFCATSLPSLQTLSMSNNNLSRVDSSWFSCSVASNLTMLDLSQNPLQSIDPDAFSSLSRLSTLTLADCLLTSLSDALFSQNVHITVLDLSGNLLSSLSRDALAPLVWLQELMLSENSLSTIECGAFDHNQQLAYLELSVNHLTSLPCCWFGNSSDATLLSLTSLSITNNWIQSICPGAFTGLTSLISLKLANNELSSLEPESFLGLSTLGELSLSANRLGALAPGVFAPLRSVTSLSLSSNAFTHLGPRWLFGLSALTSLDLSSNPIVNGIDEEAFVGLFALYQLDLQQCQLQVPLPPLVFQPFSNTLRRLNLAYNQLSAEDLPRGLFCPANETAKSIYMQVDLSFNQLANMPRMIGDISPGLQSLQLQANQLVMSKMMNLFGGDEQFPSFPELQSLTLDNNQLGELSPESMRWLSLTAATLYTLSAQRAGVTAIQGAAFSGVPQLSLLILSDNFELSFLSANAFQGTALAQLQLVACNISSLPVGIFDGLPLESVQLQKNPLELLQPRQFAGQNTLWVLNLEECQLQALPEDVFLGCTALQQLFLTNNRLASMPLNVFADCLSLQQLRLQNNQLLALPELPATLESITLATNHLTSSGIPCGLFDNKPYLNTIDLANNWLDTLSCTCPLAKNAPLITGVFLSQNHISTVYSCAFVGMPNLLSLDLSGNALTNIPVIHAPSLRYLLLNDNNITAVQGDLLPSSLMNIQLAGNQLTNAASLLNAVSPQQLSGLHTVSLSQNLLQGSVAVPEGLSADLSSNNISDVSVGSGQVPGIVEFFNNAFPPPYCPPGTYGTYPSCNGFCSFSCLSGSCSGPAIVDCCPTKRTGPGCAYAFGCDGVTCADGGTCVTSGSGGSDDFRCVCVSGMLSYKPTSSLVLETTNMPLCIAECNQSSMYQLGDECFDCDDSCTSGCNGPLPSNCNDPAALKQHRTIEAAIGALVCVLVIAIVVVAFIVRRARSRRQKEAHDHESKYRMLQECFDMVWSINYMDVQWDRVLARGAFGEVWLADWFGRTVAVKKLMMHVAETDAQSITDFEQEVAFLKQLRHRNVVLFHGTGVTPSDSGDAPFIVLEYMSRGSLRDILDDEHLPLDWDVRCSLTSDIARGMGYLHSREPPILHRDLKAQNVFINDRWIGKIGDFGESRVVSRLQQDFLHPSSSNTRVDMSGESSGYGMTSKKGTIGWRAPEMESDHAEYGLKSDVYSFAITTWEIITRQLPFGEYPMWRIPSVVLAGTRPAIPSACPTALRHVIELCWSTNPDERPTFAEVVPLVDGAEVLMDAAPDITSNV